MAKEMISMQEIIDTLGEKLLQTAESLDKASKLIASLQQQQNKIRELEISSVIEVQTAIVERLEWMQPKVVEYTNRVDYAVRQIQKLESAMKSTQDTVDRIMAMFPGPIFPNGDNHGT